MAGTRNPICTSIIVAAYVDERLPMEKCAERFGVSLATIQRRLKEAGVKSRPHREPGPPKPPKPAKPARESFDKKAWMKQYRVDHKDEIAANRKVYREETRERDAEKNAARTRKWIEENRAKHDARMKEQYAKDPERFKQSAKASRQRRRAEDEVAFNAKEAEYKRERRRTDLRFAVNGRMSNRMFYALRTGKASKSWQTLVPYTLDELIAHLLTTMPAGYSWEDLLSGALHIDHVIPVAAFNFTSPDDADFKRCWALSNLQLLPALENIRKGARLAAPFQPSLL